MILSRIHRYPLHSFGRFIADSVRMGAYRAALERAVRPGDAVLDIGTGTGVFALLAARLGARRVYAVEPHDVIDLGRRIAKANGLLDRIDFIQALSTDVDLPERVDVIVSDLRGVVPLFQNHLPTIIDARERFLVPGGRLIPLRDDLWVGLVSCPDKYDRDYDVPWLKNDLGLDMSEARGQLMNDWHKVSLGAEHLIGMPQHLMTLDYGTILDAHLRKTVQWSVDQPTIASGLAVWFEATLLDAIGYSNRPGQPELIYGQAFFPLEQATMLEPGDQVRVLISGDPVEDRHIWRWDTTIVGRRGEKKQKFTQSTLWNYLADIETVRRRRPNHVPAPGRGADAALALLAQVDGSRTLSDIASNLATRFPEQFRDQMHALDFAAELLAWLE